MSKLNARPTNLEQQAAVALTKLRKRAMLARKRTLRFGKSRLSVNLDDVLIMHDMIPFHGSAVMNAVPPDAGKLKVRR